MEKFFPKLGKADLSKLRITPEGEYSVSRPKEAKQILDLVLSHIRPHKARDLTVLDLTSNVGGDTIHFATKFQKVIGLEWNPDNFKVLKHNLSVYGLQNVEIHNTDSSKSFSKYKADIVIMDPPWGGPDYKEKKNLNLFLGDTNVLDLLTKLATKKGWKPKFVVAKVPFNFNFAGLQEVKGYESAHRYKVRNFYILIFKVLDE